MPSTITVEKDSCPMYTSRPWVVWLNDPELSSSRYAAGTAKLSRLRVDYYGFRTKREAEATAVRAREFLAIHGTYPTAIRQPKGAE